MTEVERVEWHHWLNGHESEQFWEIVKGRGAHMLQSMGLKRVKHNLVTEQQQWETTLKRKYIYCYIEVGYPSFIFVILSFTVRIFALVYRAYSHIPSYCFQIGNCYCLIKNLLKHHVSWLIMSRFHILTFQYVIQTPLNHSFLSECLTGCMEHRRVRYSHLHFGLCSEWG